MVAVFTHTLVSSIVRGRCLYDVLFYQNLKLNSLINSLVRSCNLLLTLLQFYYSRRLISTNTRHGADDIEMVSKIVIVMDLLCCRRKCRVVVGWQSRR